MTLNISELVILIGLIFFFLPFRPSTPAVTYPKLNQIGFAMFCCGLLTLLMQIGAKVLVGHA